MERLSRLAELIKARNEIAVEIAKIIGRPAQIGHVGEYIAAQIFGICLEQSASHKGNDGYFAEGPLVGRTVNIKFYAKNERVLDLNPDDIADFYLVLTGPKSNAASSRGSTRPWLIKSVFLFSGRDLVKELQRKNIKIGIATSVKSKYWELAEIYPQQKNKLLPISDEQKNMLALFA